MKVRYIFYALAITVGVAIGVLRFLNEHAEDTRFTLVNETDSALSELTVEICKQTYISRSLSPGSKHTFSHVIMGSKCAYNVQVRDADGRIHELDPEHILDRL
jgi:hypothetical protein